MTAPKPAAVSRTLQTPATPLDTLTLLLYLAERRLSGDLHIVSGPHTRRIRFENGRVARAESDDRNDRLGQLVQRQGRLSALDLARAERRLRSLFGRPRRDRKFGEILLDMHLISELELKRFLEIQLRERVLACLDLTEGTCRFEEGPGRPAPPDAPPTLLHVREVVFEAVKERMPGAQLPPLFDRIRRAWPMKLAVGWKEIPVSLTTRDAFVLTRIEMAKGIDDLIKSTSLPEGETLRTLLAMICTGILQVAGQGRETLLGLDKLDRAVVTRKAQPAAGPPPGDEGAAQPPQLPLVVEPFSREANGFRVLWTHLKALHEADGRQVFCLTSPQAHEGKTFVACNLALACAENPDQRVLLIDADLRKPNVQNMLNLPRAPGLTDVLRDGAEDSPPPLPVVRVQRLDVLTAGRPVANPVELLGGAGLRTLLEQLRRLYTLVVVDTPPCLPVVDTKIISELTDGTLLVVRRDVTTLPELQDALSEISPDRLIGFLFNEERCGRRNRRSKGYYYHQG